MGILKKVFNICTCCLGPLFWLWLKEQMKFSTWRLNRQVLLGVSCSLCCVTMILVTVLSVNMILLFESTNRDLTTEVTDDMLDHFGKRSMDVSNALNNLRIFSAQNVMKNKAVLEQSIDKTYFTPYPLDHTLFTPIQFSQIPETEKNLTTSGQYISRENLTYSMSPEHDIENY